MNPELARRILAVKSKLANAKAQIDLHTKVAAAASDELLQILSDPAMEAALAADIQQPTRTMTTEAPTPGIRDVSSGRVVSQTASRAVIVRPALARNDNTEAELENT